MQHQITFARIKTSVPRISLILIYEDKSISFTKQEK